MNYIVFDLEATCWLGHPPKGITEIIEIGALKLDDYGTVQDVFTRFVKPVHNPVLSGFCKRLTSITQENVDRADTFEQVIESFIDFCEIENDDYLLCAWGPTDKRLIAENCNLFDIENNWLANHIDIKKQYHQIKGNKIERGLKAITKVEGFEFSGKQHRAIYDAENLAKIVAKYIDEWVY